MFTKHKIWWICLFSATIVVSAVTASSITLTGMFMSIAGHFAFAIGLSCVPLAVYYLLGKPLNSEEFLATVTFSWLLLAVANLAVIP